MRSLGLASRSLASLLLLGACAGGPGPDPGGEGDGGAADSGGGASCRPQPQPEDCPVTLRTTSPGAPRELFVAGEWNGFSPTAQRLEGPDGGGGYSVSLRLPPGVYGYKLVSGGAWSLDGDSGYRKYVGGVENSALRVRDCSLPALAVQAGSLRNERPAPGAGRFEATVTVQPPAGRDGGAALCRLRATLRGPADPVDAPGRELSAAELVRAGDGLSARLSLAGLPDGKYTLRLTPGVASSEGGIKDGEALLLPFWIEARPFSIRDTPIYMAMTDRFRDGDPGNNPAALPDVPRAADYQGGDLAGVRAAIADGYFDERGIKALWLTPWQTQPTGRYRDQSNRYWVSPYHGYWPVRAREVDPRLGGAAALSALVAEAHRHGIRVLMDAVLNHVHREHEYFQDPQKRSWFRTGCICGTDKCDWTDKRLECLFADYMPDIDWTVTAASEQFIEDALWWMETFDLDGLRIDAVKHVEDLAIFNMGLRVRERFAQGGADPYLLGETAMGWEDTSVAGNGNQYGTIKRYMGPGALSGQFDFVLYHAVPYRVFARDDGGNRRFQHTAFWEQASRDQFRGFDMVNYLGSHDTSRFVTLSTYRGQGPGWERDVADRKWQDLPLPPPDREPYDRLWLGMLNFLTIPGVPLLYYGDEYGEYGGGDPDNRHAMRFSGRAPLEEAQDARMTALLKARAALHGLQRGDAVQVALLSEDLWAYGRADADPRHSALVVLNRLGTAQAAMVPVPAELGWSAGEALKDHLTGQRYSAATTLMVMVPPRGGVVLGRE